MIKKLNGILLDKLTELKEALSGQEENIYLVVHPEQVSHLTMNAGVRKLKLITLVSRFGEQVRRLLRKQ